MTFLRASAVFFILALLSSSASASLPAESQAFLDKYSSKITKLYVSGGTAAVDDATVTADPSSQTTQNNSSQTSSNNNQNTNQNNNNNQSNNNSSSPLGLDTTQNSGNHYNGIGLGVRNENETNVGTNPIQTNSIPGGNTNQSGPGNTNSGYNSEHM